MPETPSTPPPQPLDVLWTPGTLAAAITGGEGLALLVALAPGGGPDRMVTFGLASLTVQWVVLLTLGGLYALRERVSAWSPPRVGWLGVALLVASTGFSWLVAWTVLAGAITPPEGGWIGLLLRLLAMALLVGLLGLAAFQTLWRAHLASLRASAAELASLHARIRPHFLFNTLNSAAALVHARPARAEEVLLDLAELFRAALSGPREASLADELALTRRYLEIEQLRFGDRLRVAWTQPETLPDLRLPSLSLQPLVENAIHHGVEPSTRGGTLEVTIRREGDALVLLVRNPVHEAAGPDAAVGGRRHAGHHVGLAATRARLDEAWPGALATRIVDGHFEAEVTLPCPAAAAP